MSDERRAWLALSLARVATGPLAALLAEFGDADSIVRQNNKTLCRFGVSERAITSLASDSDDVLDAALSWAAEKDNHLIGANDENYPSLLRQLKDWPALLYLKGNADALHLPMLAIVGSRNPTRGGVDNARNFSTHLAKCGFSIGSGLAQGIDTAAHRGALDAAAPTVAVLGHGIDRVYPAANRELAHAITEHGALVSEYPLGTPPRREHFPARNRLISGLSLGVLVVEAAYRSGSLITARLAAEQGREVFAIPGSIHNPLARGCHRLLKDGAKLVESAADIIDELRPLVSHLRELESRENTKVSAVDERDADYQKLLGAMGFEPASADEIAAASGLTIDQVSSMLLILELEGEVAVLQGGRFSRLAKS
ncbi:MAG: DNA-protecting protein DprA [Woeseia sp.]|nr:DNA-processing protein DprA [Woeseia sp.]MBT8097901.1 DNA-processing protein DprA [Woeseia sp.]NNE60765.1 DNA-protecting protein DprA [Woeseia sp.]NNL55387.1 DNA-protecting protein DprA [Woeseia sp.]